MAGAVTACKQKVTIQDCSSGDAYDLPELDSEAYGLNREIIRDLSYEWDYTRKLEDVDEGMTIRSACLCRPTRLLMNLTSQKV